MHFVMQSILKGLFDSRLFWYDPTDRLVHWIILITYDSCVRCEHLHTIIHSTCHCRKTFVYLFYFIEIFFCTFYVAAVECVLCQTHK